MDVELVTRGDTALEVSRWFWLIFTFIQVVYIWITSPILFAYYDTDERRSNFKRLWDAIRIQLPLLITITILILPTFYLINEVRIPADKADLIDEVPNEEIDGEMYFVDKESIAQHTLAVTTILGQFFISIFGGIGVVFLPYNLLNDFIFRPKPLTEASFIKRQKIILPKLINMRKEAKKLDIERM